MKKTLPFVPYFVLLAVSAFAAGPQPVVSHTFLCTGSSFDQSGPCPQGGRPDFLIQGSDGDFYGTAQVSQEGSSTPTGGTVFSLTPAGKFTLLHTFQAGSNNNYPNGNLPGQLTEGSDGKLYGDTVYGGVGGCNGYCGGGVLYRINKDGTGFQIIHKFCSQTNCTDGGAGALVAAQDGNLYGASGVGGTGNCGSYYQGCGVIFRVTPSTGKYAVVVNFNQTTNGAFPSNLAPASDGTFYGLNFGTSSDNLFHFIPSTGEVQTTPVVFPLFNGLPSHGGDLTFGANGHLYGLYTIYATSGEGVFELQTDGSNLQFFPFYTTQEGAGSPDGLMLGTDGNFWMANYNGKSGYGSIIELSPIDGSLMQTQPPFSATAAVGAYPSQIIQASDGTFWGSTYGYGKSPQGHFADGTVYSLNLGLPPK
jgi:uncharacterized repeat protein (TIGR03803 family)